MGLAEPSEPVARGQDSSTDALGGACLLALQSEGGWSPTEEAAL